MGNFTNKELQSLIDFSESLPALPGGHPFSVVENARWSSTTLALFTDRAWILNIGVGIAQPFTKGSGGRAWPVRGGQ